MFAIVTSCENLTEEEMLLPLNEKIGLVRGSPGQDLYSDSSSLEVMEHAGVAVTITTLTDMVAFTIAVLVTKVNFVRLLVMLKACLSQTFTFLVVTFAPMPS